jgi:hypothetical protein
MRRSRSSRRRVPEDKREVKCEERGVSRRRGEDVRVFSRRGILVAVTSTFAADGHVRLLSSCTTHTVFPSMDVYDNLSSIVPCTRSEAQSRPRQ